MEQQGEQVEQTEQVERVRRAAQASACGEPLGGIASVGVELALGDEVEPC